MDRPSAATIREMSPSVIRTPTAWLAISPRMAPINIAVIGATENEARRRFAESATAWALLHDAPDPAEQDG